MEQLSFARGTATGRPRRVSADDWDALDAAHEQVIAEETLGIRRDERWWQKRVFQTDEEDESPYVYAWERDGNVRGYVVYTFTESEDGFDGRRIDVENLVATDDDAYRGLLGFLADHDSQAMAVNLYAPDDALPERVRTPEDVECTVKTGPMVRVVDVIDALSTMPYPDDANADLTIAVDDDTAPWNDDVFDLAVAEGQATCERSESEATDADVTIEVGTLSQLVVGYRDIETLSRVTDLSVADDAAASELAALFPPERVVVRDFF